MRHAEPERGHDGELERHADEDEPRGPGDAREVVGRERDPHAQHDHLQPRLDVREEPRERPREDERGEAPERDPEREEADERAHEAGRSFSRKCSSTRWSARCVGWPFAVDEILREHAMRDALDPVRVARAGVDLDALEPIAELVAEAIEARLRAEGVVGEAEPEHAKLVVLHAALELMELAIRYVKLARLADRERGLREDGRHHPRVDREREREVAREAHPDRADAGTADLVMEREAERAEHARDLTACRPSRRP